MVTVTVLIRDGSICNVLTLEELEVLWMVREDCSYAADQGFIVVRRLILT